MILWLAQGFRLGRIPWAPGTFGSLLGLFWLAGLLALGNAWLFLAGMLAGFLGSVWCCGRAEKILGQTDPPSVVLDEIVAIPLCFTGWLVWQWVRTGTLLAPAQVVQSHTWPWTVGILLAFRFFDIAKPWPIYQSQKLPGGWGVTVDDLLAAAYVNFVTLLALYAMS